MFPSLSTWVDFYFTNMDFQYLLNWIVEMYDDTVLVSIQTPTPDQAVTSFIRWRVSRHARPAHWADQSDARVECDADQSHWATSNRTGIDLLPTNLELWQTVNVTPWVHMLQNLWYIYTLISYILQHSYLLFFRRKGLLDSSSTTKFNKLGQNEVSCNCKPVFGRINSCWREREKWWRWNRYWNWFGNHIFLVSSYLHCIQYCSTSD